MDKQKNLQTKKFRSVEIAGALSAIYETVKKEKRARTAEETKTFDNLVVERDILDGEIQTLEREVREGAAGAQHVDGGRPVNWNATNDDNYEILKRDNKGQPSVFTIYKKTREQNTVADFIGRNFHVGESEKYTPGALVAAYLRGAKNDSEQRALSEGSSAAGGYTVPILVSARLLDNIRAKSVLFKRGAQTFVLDSQQQSMAKIVTDATAAWVGEGSAVTASDPVLGSVAFSAKALKATIKASAELLQDSLNIDQVINYSLTGAFAAEVDNAGINGAGSATVPKGILNYSAPSSYAMGTNGTTITSYDPFCELLKVMNDNNNPYANTIITSPKVMLALNKLKDTTNQPLRLPFIIEKMGLFDSTEVPTNLTKGTSTTVCSAVIMADISNLYYGSRLETTIFPTNESLAGNGLFSFFAMMRGDWAPVREASFGVIKDIL